MKALNGLIATASGIVVLAIVVAFCYGYGTLIVALFNVSSQEGNIHALRGFVGFLGLVMTGVVTALAHAIGSFIWDEIRYR